MDFKNFIDILSAPQNIGSNKWVLNNFGDLKSSNDYLHIIRLRYDNRWLKVYWDGKLKEVEKDYNFYVATPLKNKLFYPTQPRSAELKLLDLNTTLSSNSLLNNFKANEVKTDFNGNFLKKIKSQVEGGEVKNNLVVDNL